jgi:hypothetical protein
VTGERLEFETGSFVFPLDARSRQAPDARRPVRSIAMRLKTTSEAESRADAARASARWLDQRERLLDQVLADSFPASDPFSIARVDARP